jgi:hypothetical protein
VRSYIHTVDGITVVMDGRPFHIDRTDRTHADILEALKANLDDDALSDILNRVKRGVEAAVRLTPFMEYSGGAVLHKGTPLHGYAVDKLVELIHKQMDPAPLANFLDKLQENPSQQTVDDLYKFLEYGRIPITKSGNFLAYKAVRRDWKDIHSGRFDNSIGANPKMARNAVDDRREQTCSRGFHVCSFDYLPSFSHADGHVVVCEVNPSDVVSIPNDYNNTKMRVCEYRVVGEVEAYYAREGKENQNVLAEQIVWDSEYTIFARVNDTDEWSEIDTSNDLEEATGIAEAELEEGFNENQNEAWSEVKVVDSGTITVFRKIAD